MKYYIYRCSKINSGRHDKIKDGLPGLVLGCTKKSLVCKANKQTMFLVYFWSFNSELPILVCKDKIHIQPEEGTFNHFPKTVYDYINKFKNLFILYDRK